MSYFCQKCNVGVSDMAYHLCLNYKRYKETKDKDFDVVEMALRKFDDTVDDKN